MSTPDIRRRTRRTIGGLMAASVIAALASLAGVASAATPPGDWYGYSSPTVEQIGAEAYCSGSTPEYFGWYDLYPGAPVDFSKTLKPGDSLQAPVTFKSSKFTLTLHDVTQGWTQTVTKALSGAARSSAETVVQVPGTFTCAKPLTLAAFTGDTVDGTPLGSLDPVQGIGGDH